MSYKLLGLHEVQKLYHLCYIKEMLIFFSFAGIRADDLILAPGMTVQFTCTAPGQLPTWYVNGRVAVTKGNCYRLTIRRAAGINATAILTVRGNHTCDAFNIYCGIVVSESQSLYARNLSQFSLVFQGLLKTSFSCY